METDGNVESVSCRIDTLEPEKRNYVARGSWKNYVAKKGSPYIYIHTCLEMMKSIDLNIAYTKKMRVSKKRGNPKNHQFFFGDFLF